MSNCPPDRENRCGEYIPDALLAVKVAQVPEVNHAPWLMMQPRFWPFVEIIRFPFPEKGALGAVGSAGPRDVLVGS